MQCTKVNGNKPIYTHYYDELDFLKTLSKEELKKLWESILPKRPYIEYIGNGLYQINGNDNFWYITDKKGAEEADKALRKAVEEYGREKVDII